ncbi:MAG: bifunctional serine/threonine-protein kinase/formylglycine-generating enzyme family protein [Gemmataceae bacterium]
MARYAILLRCIGEAVVARGLKGLLGFVPYGDKLYDIAQDAYDRYKQQCQVEDGLAQVEAAAQASFSEIKVMARATFNDIRAAANRPEVSIALERVEVQTALIGYLEQVPAAIRSTFRRPADPSGKSMPHNFSVRKPEVFLRLLPARPPRFQVGYRVANEWVLADLLGVGGFGEVWKANPATGQGPPVAVKFCLDADAVRYLRHEARLMDQVMAKARGPGVVELHQAYLDNDPPCLAYEFVNGGDVCGLMHDWLRLSVAKRVPLATRVVLKLARILGPLHRLDPPIVHRDLKPANLLVVRKDGGKFDLKIGDFGIGGLAAKKALATSTRGVSRGDLLSQTLRGTHTPHYASPEQVRGEAPDPRDDVHALGVIWFQLLTCDLQRGVGADFDEDLKELGVPEGTAAAIKRCVASRKERRFADAQELADCIDRLEQDIPEAEVDPAIPLATPVFAPSPSEAITTTASSAVTAPAWPPPDNNARRKGGTRNASKPGGRVVPLMVAAGCAAVLFTLVAAAYWLIGSARPRDGDNQPTTTPVVRKPTDDDGKAVVRTIAPTIPAGKQAGPPVALQPDKVAVNRPDEPPSGRPGTLPEAAPIRPGREAGERTTVSLGDGVEMLFVWCPPGTFLMGSPEDEEGRADDETQHKVTLTQGYWLGTHEVTQKQWREVMGDNPSNFKGDDLPVENVTWDDCQSFCTKLAGKTGKRFRLPTEAEWEYACRAGTTTPFHFGQTISTDQANYNGTYTYGRGEKGEYRQKTIPEGSFPANAWGLYDMHGNIWEWCQDWYSSHPSGDIKDPPGPSIGDTRVLRGGSWDDLPRRCRAAFRCRTDPGHRSVDYGCRVVLCVDSPTSPPEGSKPAGAGGGSGADASTPSLPSPAEKGSAGKKPGERSTVSFGGGVEMKFAWCPPGTFQMGSPEDEEKRDVDETQHRVTLTQGYWLGVMR